MTEIREGMVAGIQSVSRTLRILDAVAAKPRGLTLQAIARAVEANVTTVHNFLATLVHEGYLAQERSRGPYTVGPRLLALANTIGVVHQELTSVALPWIERFRDQVDETLHLSVLVGREATDILFIESSQSVRFTSSVGKRMPLHASAAGKILLAWRPPGDVDGLLDATLPAYTTETVTDRTELDQHLAEVRDRGYAVNLGELDPSVRCIAGPIRDRNGQVVAALSMSAPVFRFPDNSVHALQDLMARTVRAISDQMSLSTNRSTLSSHGDAAGPISHDTPISPAPGVGAGGRTA
ncbi:IclR family transcriptional regulator [Verrucosispora sp. WMMD573]|uniref:IclR family transcriptional regulator n=1 Tax=Verrucosispora sp. WMMD573 TaxID=3015149 RepID=UPI00248D03B8|nr:IclR family transcriptional regulator [Verrucosispora sp. WMMD573]WBB54433.1 IclR family transcriptional regulator [Verrucosispora sp. WMMD573]